MVTGKTARIEHLHLMHEGRRVADGCRFWGADVIIGDSPFGLYVMSPSRPVVVAFELDEFMSGFAVTADGKRRFVFARDGARRSYVVTNREE